MRKILILILFFALSNCGYTKIYNNDTNIKIKINVIEAEGDSKINNILISEIKRVSREDFKKEFDVKVNTNYEKQIISKDSAGNASTYNIKLTVNFMIVMNDENLQLNFQEELFIDNNNNLFEQKNYERNIKSNFVSTIVNKLIEQLASIE